MAVEGTRIVTAPARGGTVVRAAGKFLIPGLWDMHVHVGDLEPEWFPLYLANGVTGVREMAGRPKNAETLRQYPAGRVGPRLVWTLAPIERVDVEQARKAVRSVRDAGASFVKVYNGLSREAYRAVLSEAGLLGMPVTGHVPDAVGWMQAVQSGQRSIEHLDGMLSAVKVNAAAGRGCWHTPTLTWHRFVAEPKSMLNDARLVYARRDYLDDWRRQASAEIRSPGWLQRAFAAVRELHAAGAPLLAGTDTPNAFVMPGFALHDELELMVRAGLSPAAALRTATWEPARYFGREKEFGTVADLVLLDANPLEDIRNTRKIAGVVANGRWIPKPAIDAMLDQVRRAVAK